MANINKIKLSGQTYNIQDLNATKTVELTQAEYDALPATAKTSNSLFIITDAQGADLSNYYTKTETDGLLDTKLDVTAYTPTDLSNYYTKSETSGATEISTALASKADTATTYTKTETDNAITAATSTKQDTLVSGTNIKTINGESILGEGNITIEGGGGVNVVQTTGTSTTDVMSQNAVTITKLDTVRVEPKTPTSNYTQLNLYLEKGNSGSQSLFTYVKTINSKSITSQNNNNLEGFSLIETSAITTSVTSSSTDSQVPSAKAVYDQLGGLKLVKLTQSEYDSLTTKDNSTLYVIVN